MPKLFLFACLMLISSLTSAQVWNRPKGGGFTQIAFSTIEANSLYSNQGDKLPIELNREVRDRTLQFYGEYGLSDRWTLSASIPLKFLETAGEEESNGDFDPVLEAGTLNALGQIQVNAVYQVLKKNAWVFSTRGQIDLNSARFDNRTGLRSGGDNWGLGAFAQGAYGSKYFFSSAQVGLKLRSNAYSHQFLAQWEAGLQYKQRLFFITSFEFQKSLENGSFDEQNGLQTGLYASELEFSAFQIKLGGYPLPNLGLWLATGGGLGGNLVARGRALSLNISYQWE